MLSHSGDLTHTQLDDIYIYFILNVVVFLLWNTFYFHMFQYCSICSILFGMIFIDFQPVTFTRPEGPAVLATSNVVQLQWQRSKEWQGVHQVLLDGQLQSLPQEAVPGVETWDGPMGKKLVS